MTDNIRPFRSLPGRRKPTPPAVTAVEVAAEFEPYRLVQARHLAGLRRAELAEQAGVAPWQIVQWESHVTGPKAYEVERLADVLGVPVGFFKRGRPMAFLDASSVFICGEGL
ncbi:helix-turn-helix domain-containing protein [Micromonospora sediminicola]|uniref:helix-turn-helix domain-containing protein n=1 Tax=Micromonospora sediminicola TaxID=946078 RepID=UPI0037B50C19